MIIKDAAGGRSSAPASPAPAQAGVASHCVPPDGTAAGRSRAQRVLNLTVIVGALGYFVDVYDLVLFSIVRVPSLNSLGVSKDDILNVGVTLLNWQMTGLLVGGIFWGILGDKRGRKSVLFGSIILYSVANIANAFVQSVEAYALLRFLAGVGLAGELGAAVTLVCEVLPKETRGYGTMIVAGVGLCGGVAAGLVADLLDWRTAYLVGGSLGVLLLVMRIGVYDSGMFEAIKDQAIARGSLRLLLGRADRLRTYLYCILVGVPIWFEMGILITFSPEIAAALGVTEPIIAGRAVLYSYVGVSVGDFATGYLSQRFRSRRKVILAALLLMAAVVVTYLLSRGLSATSFYALCVALGLSAGYWAVFVTVAAEQFGTNLRATVTTTVPNFVRGATVPITLAFRALSEPFGLVGSAFAVGSVCFALAIFSLSQITETYGRDLDYVDR